MEKFNRQDAYFGIHFDLPFSKIEGKRDIKKNIEEIIDTVKPDFLQCNSKHGFGLATFDTKYGEIIPGYYDDFFATWRSVTKEKGVGIYAHYAVWYNLAYIKAHEEQAQQNADGSLRIGNPKPHVTYDSPYLDTVVIPQLCEIAGKYGFDGVWLDCMVAECIGDYRPEICEEFKKQYGIEPPKEKGDENYGKWMEFTRSRFCRILKYITENVHKKYPDFEICDAWDFTTYHLVAPNGGTDFISGDVWGADVLNNIRTESRYIEHQGLPWDLMPWAFASSNNGGGYYKPDRTAEQMEQFAAATISHGGGIQFYIMEDIDAGVDIKRVEPLRKVSEFCKERKDVCFHSESASEIGVFLSKSAGEKINPHAFGFWDGGLKPLTGVLECMLNGQNSVDVLCDHHLDEKIDNYKLIVVPEWAEVSNKEQLLKFAENGGSLLIIGSESTRFFEKELGVKISETKDLVAFYCDVDGYMASLGSPTKMNCLSLDGAQVIAEAHFSPERSSKAFPIATVNDYGKGKIAGVYCNIGEQYMAGRCVGFAKLLKNIVDAIVENPIVSVKSPSEVEVAVRKKDGRLFVNLLNGSGAHNNPNVLSYDTIGLLPNITVSVRADKKPTAVVKHPYKKEIEFEYNNGYVTFKADLLEMLDIYEIVE